MGKACVVTGFSDVDAFKTLPTHLQKVYVNIPDKTVCETLYRNRGYNYRLDDSMIISVLASSRGCMARATETLEDPWSASIRLVQNIICMALLAGEKDAEFLSSLGSTQM